MVVHTSHYTNHSNHNDSDKRQWQGTKGRQVANTCRYNDKEGQVMKTKMNNIYLAGGHTVCSMIQQVGVCAMIPACTWHTNACRSPGHVLSPSRFGGQTSMHVQQLLKQLYHHYVCTLMFLQSAFQWPSRMWMTIACIRCFSVLLSHTCVYLYHLPSPFPDDDLVWVLKRWIKVNLG